MCPDNYVLDYQDGIISSQVLRVVELIVHIFLSLTLIITGLVCNYFNIRVFINQGFRKHPLNVTLFSLVLTDFISLLCALLYRSSIIMKVICDSEDYIYWYKVCVYYFGGFQTAFARAGFSLTALLSIEQWISIMFPLRAKSWLTVSRLVKIVAFLFVAYTAFFIPIGLFISIKRGLNSNNITSFVVTFDFKGSDEEATAFKIIFLSMLVIIPSVSQFIIIFCTISIIIKFRKVRKWRKESNNGLQPTPRRVSIQESCLVKAMLAILIIFLICELPMSVFLRVRMFSENALYTRQRHNLYLVFFIAFSFLQTLNSSVKFFVFIAFSSAFRETFQKLYPCCGKCCLCIPRACSCSKKKELHPSSTASETISFLSDRKEQGEVRIYREDKD